MDNAVFKKLYDISVIIFDTINTKIQSTSELVTIKHSIILTNKFLKRGIKMLTKRYLMLLKKLQIL